jgi:hypothetical protein
MYRFHCSVHALPTGVSEGSTVELPEGEVKSLAVRREKLAAAMSVSFEHAYETLARLPRMFIEQDGSFVWVSASGESKWQVDGNLYDRAGLLIFVDLKGFCPANRFDEVISAFRGPTPLMFQLVRHALFVNEPEFRSYAQKAYLVGSVGEVY